MSWEQKNSKEVLLFCNLLGYLKNKTFKIIPALATVWATLDNKLGHFLI